MNQKEMDSHEYGRFMRKVEEARNGDPHESSWERQKKIDNLYEELDGYYGSYKEMAKTRIEH